MAEPKQDVIITIPGNISAADREVLGNEIARFIIERTRKGLDINNRPFKAYSESYKDSIDFDNAGKTNRVNLTLTGEMLNTVELLSHGLGFVKIGFDDSESNDKASFNRQNGRDFLGINQKDLNLLISKFTSQTAAERSRSDIAQSVASSFLRGLFGGQ